MKENICSSCGAKNFIDRKNCAYCNSPLNTNVDEMQEKQMMTNTNIYTHNNSSISEEKIEDSRKKVKSIYKLLFIFFLIFFLFAVFLMIKNIIEYNNFFDMI